MKRCALAAGVLLTILAFAIGADKPVKPLVTGLKNPSAVTTAVDGAIFVTAGAPEKGGAVYTIDGGKAVLLAGGFEDPRAIVTWKEFLFVADKDKVWKVDRKGTTSVYAALDAFPSKPASIQGLAVDEVGALYVTDAGKDGAAVFRIDPMGKVTSVADSKRTPALQAPGAVVMDGLSFLLVLDTKSGQLLRLKIADGTTTKVADGLGEPGGLAWDYFGRLYVVDRKENRVAIFPRPGAAAVLVTFATTSMGGLGLGPMGKSVLVISPKDGSITELPTVVPGQEVDASPLPIETVAAFPDLQWTGWKPENDKGQLEPFRPILLTHAGDGSNRVFVPTEQGVIHVFPNDQKAAKSTIFLNIQNKVTYDEKQNEEGFLGLAFHPKFKDNGEFFVFYTVKEPKLTNVLSRFKVRKDDPTQADPASEEELLRITRPYWNHDGGTLCFGPDRYLYIALGDGGLANDPQENGQNLKTLLGKVLRIDVDHKDDGKRYAVPKDNPFVKMADARPEIWCYGLRNIWRMSFDRKTGKLWAGDVGQNLYEEIDILTAGGNYGWSVREGLHPFSVNGTGPRKDLIDPIWEYHHDVGKCIIGGHVYRGSRLPELDGMYLYADYVTGKIWALKYDEEKGRVVANRPLTDRGLPILSFGEDEKGEVYCMTYTPSGRGLYYFAKKKE
jgi:glucose/arabinose dehydrogenase